MKIFFPEPVIRNPKKIDISSVLPSHIDYYVSPQGDDGNCGISPDCPFATIERARLAVKEKICSENIVESEIVVKVGKGEYRTSGVLFDENDFVPDGVKVTYTGFSENSHDEVVITGAFALPPEDFLPVLTNAGISIINRLSPDARKHIMMIDLKKYGISEEDYGSPCAFGAGSNAALYDDDTVGVNLEIFFNDRRMVCARYPNEGKFIKIEEVIDVGDTQEFPPQVYRSDFKNIKNPKGGKFIVDKETNNRIKKWKKVDDVWIYGYFYWDWSDMSTPVKSIEPEVRTLTTAHCSAFGFRKDAPYYFYNVFEELDKPGEWYLDRENSILYIYPYEKITKDTKVELSLLTVPVMNLHKCRNMSFEGISFKCTRDNAINLHECENISFKYCSVSNVYRTGIHGDKCENIKISGCEISHTGDFGINLHGGDRVNLKSGRNVIDNSYVHNFAEISRTCICGINIEGVGGVISHCEIHSSPTVGIGYTGNDHLIEYNIIHDVVLNSDDAAAIYSGCSWTSRGTVIRRNIIYNIGSDESKPDGIYWDDGMSGQTAYENLIVNVGKYGFMIGGGNGNTVVKNIIISNGESPIQYDARCREAIVNDGWAKALVLPIGHGILWNILHNNPYKSEIWTAKYPILSKFNENPESYDDPHFPPNPSFSTISKNVIVNKNMDEGIIAQSVRQFSNIYENLIFPDLKSAGISIDESGKYTILEDSPIYSAISDFPEIPFDEAGRYAVLQ